MTEVRYDRHGRMQYHPDYHENHKKPWMVSDEKYLVEMYTQIGPDAVAAALGRTIGVVMTRIYQLRKDGKAPRVDNRKAKKTFKRTRRL